MPVEDSTGAQPPPVQWKVQGGSPEGTLAWGCKSRQSPRMTPRVLPPIVFHVADHHDITGALDRSCPTAVAVGSLRRFQF